MKMRVYVWFGVSVLGMALAVFAISQTAPDSHSIPVQVNYTGAGTVNGTHKIIVALWDTPEFVTGAVRPVAIESTDSKTGTVTFARVSKLPAYVSVAYDPSGKWDGESGPPPSGSSVGMYSKTPPKPAPVDVSAGKSVIVKISFSDITKLP